MSHHLVGMAVPFGDMNHYPSDLISRLIKGEARLEGRPKEYLVVPTKNGGVSQQVRQQGHIGNKMSRNEIR